MARRGRLVGAALACLAAAGAAALLARTGPGGPDPVPVEDAPPRPAPSPGALLGARDASPGAPEAPAPAPERAPRNVLRGRVLAPSGEPAPGARVTATPLDRLGWGQEDPDASIARTADDRGEFAFEDVRAGAYAVSARGDAGVGFLPLVRVAAEGTTPADVRLQAPAAIEGRVVDPAGAPIAGARVATDANAPLDALYRGLFDRRLPARAETAAVTDAQGRFRLTPLQPGPHGVTARAALRLDESLEVRAPATGVRLALRPAGAVTGVVVLGEGPPPKAVWVRAHAVTTELTIAPANGEAAFAFENLAPATYRIRASGPGYGLAEAEVRVVAGERAGPLRLFLAPGTAVSGFVREHGSDLPIPDAEVLCSSVERSGGSGHSRREEERLRTDARGAWSARLRPGEWVVEASKEGLARPERTEPEFLVVGTQPLAGVVRFLEASPAIEGVVTYPDGEPAVGVEVDVATARQNEARPRGTITSSSEFRDETDLEGRFRIPGLVTYGRYGLVVTGPGRATATLEDVVFEVGRTLASVRITLPRPVETGVRVTGRIVDEGGAPVAGAMASFGGRSAATTADGTFVREKVPPGRYHARYGAPGHALCISPLVEVGREDVRLPDWVLRRSGVVVSGRVTSRAGAAVSGASVLCAFLLPDPVVREEPSYDSRHLATRTDAEGRYRLEGPGLESGTANVSVSATGFQHASGPFPIGREVVADFVLEGYGRLTGTIAFGGPPPERLVVQYASDRLGTGDAAVEWAPGRSLVELSHVPAGRRRLRFRAEGYAPAFVREVEVREGEASSFGSVRMTSGGTAAGRILDAAGRPLADVQVSQQETFLHVDTDADGRWSIPHLPPGTWTFHVNAVPGYDGRRAPTFTQTVEEGATSTTEQRLPP